MSDTSLDFLLSEILSPDNVQRAAAEKELERRGLEVPGFCFSLARYCRTLMGNQSSHAVALVALAVLKRSVTASDRAEELEQVVSSLLSDLTDIAALPGGAAAAMRQWSSTVCTTVRRLAVLCASPTAAPAAGQATTGAITAQLLGAFDQYPNADASGLLSVFSHVWLLRTMFEEPVPELMHAWCAELLLNCAPPLFEILCAGTAATLSMASSDSSAFAADSPEVYARCSLLTLIAQTLAALYEWQFASSGRKRFPAELKQHFLSAYPLLQSFMCTPCARWLSVCVGATSSASALPCAQARAANFAAASLAALEYVSSVLQLGGWYKRCVSAQLFQALLQSLEADAACYGVALCVDVEEEAESLTASAGWTGWPHTGSGGGEQGDDASSHSWTTVVRRRATQCWSLFLDAALLPFLKVGLVDVVGYQCGLQYYKLLLAYAVPSPVDVGSWLHDPNTFLREEEEREDRVRWSTRNTVAQLYADSIAALGPLFLHASLEDLHERLLAPIPDNDGRTCGDGQTSLAYDGTVMLTASQQQREAALFFMETVLKHRSRQLRECGAVDFTPLATHLWSNDVASASAHPGLTARTLMLIAAIVRFTHATLVATEPAASADAAAATNTEAAAEGFMATVVADSTHALSLFTGTSKETIAASSSSCTPLVAVLLCRVLQRTLPYWSDVLLAQHSVAWQVSLLALLSSEAGLTDEALYNTVEQLTDLLKISRAARKKSAQPHYGRVSTAAAAPPMLDALPRTVMDCWRRHVSDPNLADAVLGLLRHVVRDGESGASFVLQELPWINGVLSGFAESTAELCAVPYFLHLLKCLFEHAPDEVANCAAAMMLDSLCQLLLCTEESAILGVSSSCLAALLRRCLAVQSVQVRVVAATVEAAMAGGATTDEGGLSGAVGTTARLADAPRTVYPFATVIVAFVLRTLAGRLDEASLMDVGDTLVAIMQKYTSFSEAELIRIIHATVRRLSIVRTDTIAQQLLAPLATLMALHPAALLRTLTQGGFLVETMSRWLPRVEHFSNLRATFVSCEGLLKMLSCLSQPSSSPMLTAEEAQQMAQQPVTCRWLLPEELTESNKGSRKASRRGSKGGSAAATRRVILSSLTPGTSVETSLPLYAGVLVGVGRGLLALLAAPPAVLWRASQAAGDTATPGTGIGAGVFPSDEDGDDSNGLFRGDSVDGSDPEAEDTWEEDVDSFSDDETQGDARELEAPDINAYSPETTDRQRLLRPMGAQMLPWMQTHGAEVASFFTLQEAQTLTSFFTSCAASGECGPSAA
ncbi:conserved hypothetical protein [Leishmania major strain Friedlin]|uniref:Importin N-terminal domain-containing protein n=1 Tax=Leishmania major TaxID=5664 RepID=Q4Q1M3_LEIMA|nr:conserved hypothetical protein [Leishmania major strain Friedlin]CAG9583726.1 hypothetical_protein_-_conserved [Leishmania major strain Friedlin]CAJ09156.1 conserved hypothetical protein [Leishmania major strain Friedlin]|eukprot:XP_001686775.1 conserved hypothetical protein [Leishmania major strain Friedlin]